MTASPQQLLELERRCMWYPFTQMQTYAAEEPLVIAGGEGPYLIDAAGRRYLDGVASLWTNVHGHRVPAIDAAIRAQLERIAHSTLLGLTHPPAIELAGRLIALAPPGLTRVFYSDNGSTAVEVALKMALQFWRQTTPPQPRKQRFVSFREGYHGDTLGAVSVGGIDLFHARYGPLLFPTLKVHGAFCYRCHLQESFPACRLRCVDELEAVLARQAEEIAAVVIEPLVQGAGGMIVAPPGHLARVRDLCRRYDVLLIADEVAVGCGRTGTFFACEQEGVAPDLLAMGKGVAAGYLPLAATLTTERIYEAFLGAPAEQKTFFHGHTFTGNPLACAAALASLDLFEKTNLVQAVREKSALLAAWLQPLRRRRSVGDIRQRGLLAGIELVRQRDSRAPFPPELTIGHRVTLAARRRGAIVRPLGHVVVLMPPLAIEPDLLRELVDIVDQAIAEAADPLAKE
ncbi:MAG: adenosylmethionine--8-amino-7-oxononanoate transaminase [Candidatus Tectomicrobia bacterium]|nr:adenosylmethionine--8-amino-7-oxononanoate transaminase [Candidatus Tectomicrobia bacterium]